MNKESLTQAIKKADAVMVWVKMTPEDGSYVQTSKRHALHAVRNYPFDHSDGFLAKVEDNIVYIN